MVGGPGIGRHFVVVRRPFLSGGLHSGHHGFFRNRCFNGPFFDPIFCRQFFINGSFGVPFFNTPFVTSPFFAPPIFSPAEPVVQEAGPSAEVAQESDLERRVESLTEDVARLRAEAEERQEPAPNPVRPLVTELPSETVLVFLDAHREMARNYAVAGKTLWVFTENRAMKIPLSLLDLAATRKANAERGVEFLLPGLK